MGILTSLFSGVSGINSAGQQLSIIGDNVANVNTVGFKASRAEFTDVLSGSIGNLSSSSNMGAGSRLAGVNQNFTQGSLESTGVTTDLSIDGGGFFIVQDTTGVFYTRAGLFRLNDEQVLVNSDGQSVLGFGMTPQGIPNGALGPIDLSSTSSIPSATSEVEVNVNLDPNDDNFSGTPSSFDMLDPVATSNFQTGIRVFDSLGNPRNILVYFVKDSTNPNEWYFYAGTNRSELDMTQYTAGGGAPFAQGANAAQDDFMVVQSGTLTFNTDGTLANVDNTQIALAFDVDGDGSTAGDGAQNPTTTPGASVGWAFANGAAITTNLVFDFGTPTSIGGTGADRTTQFGGSAASGVNNFVRFMNQNGYSQGELQAVSVDENGFVTGSFSNGQTVRLAQVALANFPAVNGLERVGRNNWVETNVSGNPIIGSPNQSGFGAVRSGFLEQSNADLADQFVKMIVAQRAFQANTRTISVSNELLAGLVNLGM